MRHPKYSCSKPERVHGWLLPVQAGVPSLMCQLAGAGKTHHHRGLRSATRCGNRHRLGQPIHIPCASKVGHQQSCGTTSFHTTKWCPLLLLAYDECVLSSDTHVQGTLPVWMLLSFADPQAGAVNLTIVTVMTSQLHQGPVQCIRENRLQVALEQHLRYCEFGWLDPTRAPNWCVIFAVVPR